MKRVLDQGSRLRAGVEGGMMMIINDIMFEWVFAGRSMHHVRESIDRSADCRAMNLCHREDSDTCLGPPRSPLLPFSGLEKKCGAVAAALDAPFPEEAAF